jgi:hypothetical protein
MMKVNSPSQCIRDVDIELSNEGTYTILLSKARDRPKWCKNNWIEIPEDATKCILMYRCYCPEIGVGLKAPTTWFNCHTLINGGGGNDASNIKTFAQAVKHAGAPEPLDNEDRVCGMYPAKFGQGASYHRLKTTIVFNMILLLLFTTTSNNIINEHQSIVGMLIGFELIYPAALHFILPAAALYGYFLYRLCFRLIARKHKKDVLVKKKDMFIPNRSVVLPESILGHPNHMYYTIHYDASQNTDVKIRGIRKSKGFTYTSVTCYGWSSLPPANGQFRYDETLVSDEVNADDNDDKDETYTLYLTTKPTFENGVNEIDVSEEPSGLCFIRIIYPESDSVVKKCKPTVEPIPQRYQAASYFSVNNNKRVDYAMRYR